MEERSGRIWESRRGWIVGTGPEGRLLVDFEQNPAGPREARNTVALSPEELNAAIAARRPVELRFENGDPGAPVLVRIAPAIPLEEWLQGFMPDRELGPTEEAAEAEAGDTGTMRVIQGQDELVLQCGKASITLRRNGKIIIKGTYVETQAEGVNRIKGGSVQIN
ncbi:DUF6484 domain-containing protein [Pyxidicoccus sp. 3LG]